MVAASTPTEQIVAVLSNVTFSTTRPNVSQRSTLLHFALCGRHTTQYFGLLSMLVFDDSKAQAAQIM